MSISRHIDLYMAERGIKPSAEVVPDSTCQVFDVSERQAAHQHSEDKLREAEEKLRTFLGD